MSIPARHRSIWRLAWPMILSNSTVPLLGIVDTAILGHLNSSIYLGAVAVGSSIMTFMLWAFGFLRMGTTSFSARAYGQKDGHLIRLIFAQATLLAASIGVLLLLIVPWLLPFALDWMQPEPAVREWAERYCRIRLFSAPAALMTYACIGWFIGQQDTRSPLLILVVANALNIGLDWLFIMHWDYKSVGAAWATVCAEYLALLLGLWMIRRRLQRTAGSMPWIQLKQWWRYADMIRVNRHLFVRTLSLLLVMTFFTAQGAQTNNTILAANAILLQLLLLTSHGLDGFAHAAEALVGKAIGARRLQSFYQTCRDTSIWALVTALAFSAVFFLAAQPIAHIFTALPEVISATLEYMPWLWLMPLLAVWSYQLDGIFIGTGQTQAMQYSMIIAAFGVFFPLWWLTQPLGNHGLWLSFSVFNISRALLLGGIFWRYSSQKVWLRVSDKSCRDQNVV